MKGAGPWTADEIGHTLILYRSMWWHSTHGEDYNKAAMIRHARGEELQQPGGEFGALVARSKGSIEMKLMNVTAALEAIGRDDLSMAEYGYRPMTNMQKALKDAVVKWAAGYKRAAAA
jgi:hypothetical protein